MYTRKHTIMALVLVLCVCLYYIWDNVLILDDLREHSFDDAYTVNIEKTQTTDPEKSGDENKEDRQNQSAPSSSKNSNVPARGYHIHISLDELKMYVYKNGELIKTYPVSGGKPTTPSPEGTWKIISKDTWGEGFGGAWLGFNVPWGKFGIHGTIYPWFIGRSNSSKGCIRMNNKDVKELYRLVPHGTTVTIIHTNRVFRTMKDGMVGSDVLEVQKALKKLGYYTGYPDGKFGPGLKNAVKKFQKEHKLWGAGMVTPQTYSLIMDKYRAKLQESENPNPAPNPAPNPDSNS